jgi:phage-related protein
MGGVVGAQAGKSLGQKLASGFQASTGNIFDKLSGALENVQGEAEAAREKFQGLTRAGYVLQAVVGPLVGGLSSLVVSIGTLVGVVGKAAPAVAALGTAFLTLKVAMAVAKAGFGNIFAAVKQATDPTKALGKSIAEIREEFQQLQFDAEQATLSESRAALNLEDALNNLRRVQDLPPNSRARREAQLAYEEAELAFRRAKDRAADLNEEVAKGPEALKDKSGSDPFAGLNAYQRDFAQYLATEIMPLIKELELELSKALLPPLKGAVEILRMELYPLLKRRLPEVAEKVGLAFQDIVIDVTAQENLEKMDSILLEMQPNIELMGDLFGNILDVILSIVDATGPLVTDFLTWAVDLTSQWSENLTTLNKDGRLDQFFADAGKYAEDLGEIIGNVFDGIGNLIGLTTGPGSAGEDMIQWMKDGTETFANMFAEDPAGGKQFFKDAFANAQSVMSSIGALIGEILGLADNPNIKTTFDTLKEGAPALGEALGKMVDAGPSFANLVVTITEIVNKLTDSEQISAFFDTLNIGAEKFSAFLDTDIAKTLLANLGPIFATFSAIGVIFDVIKFAFLTIVGYFAAFFTFKKGIMPLFDGMAKGLGKIKFLGPIFTKLGGGGLFAIFVLLVQKAVEFYNTIDGFKTMVDNVFKTIGDSFGELFAEIERTFALIFGGEDGGGLFSVLDPIIQVILEVLIPALGFLLSTFIDVVTMILSWVNNLIEGVIPGFQTIVDGIMLLFSGDLMGGLGKIGEGIGKLIGGIFQFVVNSIIDLINFGIKAVNNLISIATDSEFGKWLGDVLGVNMKSFQIGLIPRVDFFSGGPLPSQVAAAGGADRALINRFNNSNAYTQFNNQRNAAINAPTQSPGASEANRGDINITVNPAPGMDVNELANAVGNRVALGIRKGTL